MYQLIWCNFANGVHHSVIGNSDTLLSIYFTMIKDKKWDVLELWQLGATTTKIPMDGVAVSWWYK